jgi:hypothetical protein
MSGNVVTITLTTKVSGTVAPTAAGSSTMTWRPSATATDVAGIPALTTLVTESGSSDRNF